MTDLDLQQDEKRRVAFLRLRVGPKAALKRSLFARLGVWLRRWLAWLFPSSVSAQQAARDTVEKAIRAGQAAFDERTVKVEKLRANVEEAFGHARQQHVAADFDEQAMSDRLSKETAEAVGEWVNVRLKAAEVGLKEAQAQQVRAQAFKEVAEGLLLLKNAQVDITDLTDHGTLKLLVTGKKDQGQN